MRSRFLLFSLILFSVIITGRPVYTQEKSGNDDIETVFDGQDFRMGGYGAPELKLTQINTIDGSEWGLMIGGRGGWIINRNISIGAAGYGLVTNHRAYSDGLTYYFYRVGMGGLFLEYIQSTTKSVHYVFNAMVGGGGISYSSPVKPMVDGRPVNPESSAFFVVEPGIAAEANITRNFRIEAGLSYRLLFGMDLAESSNQDLAGLSINLAFKFGRF